MLLISLSLFLSAALAQFTPILPKYAEYEGSTMFFFPNISLRGATATLDVAYDTEIGKIYALLQFTSSTYSYKLYMNHTEAYLVTDVDGFNYVCRSVTLTITLTIN